MENVLVESRQVKFLVVLFAENIVMDILKLQILKALNMTGMVAHADVVVKEEMSNMIGIVAKNADVVAKIERSIIGYKQEAKYLRKNLLTLALMTEVRGLFITINARNVVRNGAAKKRHSKRLYNPIKNHPFIYFLHSGHFYLCE